MSDEKKYTEKDLVLAMRKGWDECAYRMTLAGGGSKESEAMKLACFPLPKVTRPRVVNGPAGRHWAWKLEDGRFWFRNDNRSAWELVRDAWKPTPELVPLWYDLLANPTEEVDA